ITKMSNIRMSKIERMSYMTLTFKLRKIHDDTLERKIRHTQLMTRLLKSEKCRDVIRMGPKDYIRVIDGTHSHVKVPKLEVPHFAEEKITPHKIWERIASDLRKFYLGDVGFMLKPRILTPYRGVWYHLKDYSV
ncbi:hypothetical protein S245_009847, partial [Arachis hypogaea]